MLTSLPDGLTSVGHGAFNNCAFLALRLTSLPDGLTSIGNYAFNRCTSLTLDETLNCRHAAALSDSASLARLAHTLKAKRTLSPSRMPASGVQNPLARNRGLAAGRPARGLSIRIHPQIRI